MVDLEPQIIPERKSSKLAEIINPVNLPEASFQSFEQFKNDAIDQKDSFFASQVDNPTFVYPCFKDTSGLDRGISRLETTIESVDGFNLKPEYADATKSSLTFRLIEMQYVKTLAALDSAVSQDEDEDVIRQLAEKARHLNEKLYGVPEQDTVDAAVNEVFANTNSKSFSPSAQKLYDELTKGFVWKDRIIDPLVPPADTTKRLPDFNDDSLAWAGEHVIEKYAHIEALLREFWDSKVEKYGDSYKCPPEDIAEAFDQALCALDPKKESGVSVKMDPTATTLSWDTAEMAVKVGAKRMPIESCDKLIEKAMHELVVHGGRAINGLKTDLPVLGTGLFTDTPRPDYLTFEEGLARTIGEAVSGERPEWGPINLARYINVSLAQQGGDFRSIFETTWRCNALMEIEDDAEVTDELVQESKEKAYRACVRTFRGAQPNLTDKVDITPLTYNKDLAYIDGRIIVLKHINELYEAKDYAGLDRLFMGKYDPTNPVQDALARSALGV
jgi:hypothetical protein